MDRRRDRGFVLRVADGRGRPFETDREEIPGLTAEGNELALAMRRKVASTDASPADRVFKVVAGGRDVDVLTNVVHQPMTSVEKLLGVRISPITFFVSVPDGAWELAELVADDFGEDVTVTEVTGTAWKV